MILPFLGDQWTITLANLAILILRKVDFCLQTLIFMVFQYIFIPFLWHNFVDSRWHSGASYESMGKQNSLHESLFPCFSFVSLVFLSFPSDTFFYNLGCITLDNPFRVWKKSTYHNSFFFSIRLLFLCHVFLESTLCGDIIITTWKKMKEGRIASTNPKTDIAKQEHNKNRAQK